MEKDFSEYSNRQKVEMFIRAYRHVSRDEIHQFINDHHMPAGMQIVYDLLAANVIEQVDGEYRIKE